MLPGNSSFIYLFFLAEVVRNTCDLESQFKNIRNPVSTNVHKFNNKDALTTICEVLKCHQE